MYGMREKKNIFIFPVVFPCHIPIFPQVCYVWVRRVTIDCQEWGHGTKGSPPYTPRRAPNSKWLTREEKRRRRRSRGALSAKARGKKEKKEKTPLFHGCLFPRPTVLPLGSCQSRPLVARRWGSGKIFQHIRGKNTFFPVNFRPGGGKKKKSAAFFSFIGKWRRVLSPPHLSLLCAAFFILESAWESRMQVIKVHHRKSWLWGPAWLL